MEKSGKKKFTNLEIGLMVTSSVLFLILLYKHTREGFDKSNLTSQSKLDKLIYEYQKNRYNYRNGRYIYYLDKDISEYESGKFDKNQQERLTTWLEMVVKS